MGERIRVIEVECGCGFNVAKYEKEGKGRLIKMYLDMILEDKAEIFKEGLPTGTEIFCPSCSKRLATIQMVHGRAAAKINQGAIKKTGT